MIRALLALLLCAPAWGAVDLSIPDGPRGALYRWAQPDGCETYAIRIAGELVREGTTEPGWTVNQSVTIPVGSPVVLAEVEACGQFPEVSMAAWERDWNWIAERDPAPEPVAMASVVQSNTGDIFSDGSISLTSAATAGNTVILVIGYRPSTASGEVNAVTDNLGNTYVRDYNDVYRASSDNGFAFNNARVAVFRADNITGGSLTATLDDDGAAQGSQVMILEVDESVTLVDDAFSLVANVLSGTVSVAGGAANWLLLGLVQTRPTTTHSASSGQTLVQISDAFGSSASIGYEEIPSAGTEAYTVGFSATSSGRGFWAWAYEPAGGGAVELVVGDSVHGHAADEPALVQAATVAAQDSLHGHTADGVSLVQAATLVAGGSVHAHVADSVALLQAATLAVADSAHAHSADEPALVQASTLAAADSVHGHVAGGVSLVEAATLATQDSVHAHAADQPTLSSGNDLAVGDSLHAHAADEPALVQASTLSPGDSAHGHAADAPTLSVSEFLAPGDSQHGHTAEAVSLGYAAVLSVEDALHAHTVDELQLTQAAVLAVGDSLHDHSSEQPTLSQSILLAPAGSAHGHTADGVTLTQAALLAVQDALHAHFADEPELLQGAVLVVGDSIHAHLADNIVLPGTVFAAGRLMVVRGTDRLMVVAPTDRLMVVRH